MTKERFESAQLDDFAPGRFRFAFGHGPQDWKRRLIACVAFQIGQIDQKVRLPLRRFSDGWFEISAAAPSELEPAERLCTLAAGKVVDLMNIGVADDQAKQ